MTDSHTNTSQAPELQESTDSKTNTQTARALPPTKRRKQAPIKKATVWPIYFILFFLVLSSCAAGIYLWQSITQQRIEMVKLASTNKNLNTQIKQVQQALVISTNKLENNTEKQIARINIIEKQNAFNTQKLGELGASSRSDWLIAEAEYLLHLANQRLGLEKDAEGAEAILIAVEQVLAEIDDPGLLPVQISLANEVLNLQQIKKVDTKNLYIKLLAIINSLNSMDATKYLLQANPITEKSTVLDSESKTEFEAIWDQVWGDLKQAFVIRRLDEVVKPLLAPEQSYYLKQNLRLMLEQASLALLDQNTHIFQTSLTKASDWLGSYYDVNNENISVVLSQINALKTLDINQSLPDISNSLRLLKTKIESMYRNHRLGRLSSPDSEAQDNKAKLMEQIK